MVVPRLIVFEEEDFRQIRTDVPLLPEKPGDEGKDPLIEAIKKSDGTGSLFEFLVSALFYDIWQSAELSDVLDFILQGQPQTRYL